MNIFVSISTKAYFVNMCVIVTAFEKSVGKFIFPKY